MLLAQIDRKKKSAFSSMPATRSRQLINVVLSLGHFSRHSFCQCGPASTGAMASKN
jgi:hypothetical protein